MEVEFDTLHRRSQALLSMYVQVLNFRLALTDHVFAEPVTMRMSGLRDMIAVTCLFYYGFHTTIFPLPCSDSLHTTHQTTQNDQKSRD